MTTDYPHMQKSLDTITHISAYPAHSLSGALWRIPGVLVPVGLP
jgi:hypothetical protein